MACPDENLVDAFVRGRIDAEDRAAMQQHLAGCSACRTVVSALASEPSLSRTVVDAPDPTLASTHAAEEKARSFASGELVANRYRIVDFLAEGGMGEVYEAEDLELRRRVALKTVRSEIATDPRALERFRREIALAHKVSHPNVCRIFDLGFHTRGERITFLTMEFLDGETLSARLRRTGRMTPAEALPIVEQLASGLAAAHAASVVHRDFKSPNVMLVPTGSSLRAVISDFGLAGSAIGDEGEGSSTGRVGLVGSPVYMAPEQVEGRKADARADLYALGVVLYEMVTGAWPFVADTPMLTAIKRLQQDPPSPLVRNPTLDARWADVILKCMARDPAQRFDSALEVLNALRVDRSPPPRRAPLWIAGGIAVVAMSAWAAWPRSRATTPLVVPTASTTAPTATAPPSTVPAQTQAQTPTLTPRRREHKAKASAHPADQWQGEIVESPDPK